MSQHPESGVPRYEGDNLRIAASPAGTLDLIRITGILPPLTADEVAAITGDHSIIKPARPEDSSDDPEAASYMAWPPLRESAITLLAAAVDGVVRRSA